MIEVKAKEEEKKPEERIMVALVRNKNGEYNGFIRTRKFTPDMIIQRCGRMYRVDADGVQHRLRETEHGKKQNKHRLPKDTQQVYDDGSDQATA